MHGATIKISRTQIIWINWDGEPFGYAENPGNWIFLGKYATLADRSLTL